MPPSPSFADLLTRLHRGDPAAAAEVFGRYAGDLVRLAAPRLAQVIRRKVDAEDVVQSAFRSFFRADPTRAFALADWDDLWALLATITLRKCRAQTRRFLTAKRHVGREEGLADLSGWEAVAAEPTPAEAAELGDTLRRLLDGLDARGRLIAELALQGYTASEIAPQVGLTERSVYRQLDRVRARLLDNDPEPEDLRR